MKSVITMLLRSILSFIAAIMITACASAATESPAKTTLAAVTHDLCDKDVVLLGENGFHGDGKTITFKTALIPMLIEQCHFSAVVFEASHYDFLEIMRRQHAGEAITQAMVSSAIGWIWNHDAEIQPLIGYLFDRVKSGTLSLAGLDDQLGSRDAFYSNDQMPKELTGYLGTTTRDVCLKLFKQRIENDYPDDAPESQIILAHMQRCLSDIEVAVAGDKNTRATKRDSILQIVNTMKRDLARDFDTDEQRILGRDHAMFLNLQWLASTLPPHSKIIIWAENTHVVKDAGADPIFAHGKNLGAYIHQAYGSRAFALGFSAAGGTFGRFNGPPQPITQAPPLSLEATAIKGNADDPAYLGPSKLAGLGKIPGAIFGHRYIGLDWVKIIDAVIVFRSERQPVRMTEVKLLYQPS